MGIEWKKIALYAIVPAVIAGLFSIAPKLYDIWNDPKAELTYQQITGPELQGAGGVQKIISVVVENTGKRSLSNVYAAVSIVGGTIESQKVDESSGLKPSTNVSKGETSLIFPKLHPSEKFTISALGLSDRPGVSAKVVVRSDDVLGTEKKETPKQGEFISLLSTLALTTAAVFVMATSFLLKVKRGTPSELFSGTSKEVVVFYIPARLGISEITTSLFLNSEMTYRKLGDMLLAQGHSLDKNRQKRAVVGLMCLLLVDRMNSDSREMVVQNLKTLTGAAFDQKEVDELIERGHTLKTDMSLRNAVEDLIRPHVALPLA